MTPYSRDDGVSDEHALYCITNTICLFLKHSAVLKCNETFRTRSIEISMSVILAITLMHISFKLNFRGTSGLQVVHQTLFFLIKSFI